MELAYHCSCGKCHHVQPFQAGTSLSCSCGRQDVLPALSELRQSAGLSAFEMSTADSILATLTSGDFDLGERCLGCDMPTTHACTVWAICERSYSYVSGGAQLSIWGLPVAETDAREENRGRDVLVPLPIRLCEVCSRRLLPGGIANALGVVGFLLAVVAIGIVFLSLLWPLLRLSIPLRWSLYAFAAAILSWLIQWRIGRRCALIMRATASKVPAYKELLDEYPDASLAVGVVAIERKEQTA